MSLLKQILNNVAQTKENTNIKVTFLDYETMIHLSLL